MGRNTSPRPQPFFLIIASTNWRLTAAELLILALPTLFHSNHPPPVSLEGGFNLKNEIKRRPGKKDTWAERFALTAEKDAAIVQLRKTSCDTNTARPIRSHSLALVVKVPPPPDSGRLELAHSPVAKTANSRSGVLLETVGPRFHQCAKRSQISSERVNTSSLS